MIKAYSRGAAKVDAEARPALFVKHVYLYCQDARGHLDISEWALERDLPYLWDQGTLCYRGCLGAQGAVDVGA
jgi:hypothetical protein